MNSYLQLLGKLPSLYLFRHVNFPKVLPINYTLIISTRCNSRCLTCNVWKQIRHDFTLEEWSKTLESIGTSPFWVTISGGEPFLQPHLADLALAVHRICKPKVLNIPTNSLQVDKILSDVTKILTACPDMQLVINLSLDGVGEHHDHIRGISGNFDKFTQNYQNLTKLKRRYPNLTVGIHSVISKFNIDQIQELVDYAYSLKPDQFITEIAEQRVELDTVGLDITPEADQYHQAITYVLNKLTSHQQPGFSKLTRAFRTEYYQFVDRWRSGVSQQVTDYAGFASVQISSWGEVWPSCIGGINLGNLRDHGHNFPSVWFSKRAQRIRQRLRTREESFPLANAFYSNALLNPSLLTKVLIKIVKS